MAIGITVQFTIKEGEGAAFEKVFADAQAIVKRDDEGCEMYDLFKSVEDDTRYVMVERWASQDLLNAHMKSPSMAEMAKVAPHMGGAPVMTKYEQE